MISSLSNLFSKNKNGIGIEITPAKINIAEISKEKQNYKLVNHLSVEVPEGLFEEGKIIDVASIAEIIQDTLVKNRIKAKTVTTALPMREAIIRIIPVPAELNEEELKDMVVNHEAPLYLPYPREEVDLDYQKLGYFVDEDGIEKVQVLLVATRKEITDSYLDVFEQSNLEINVLEISSFAMIRTIREQLRQFNSEEAVVLVDIEFDSTEIAIIVDGVPQFSRNLPIGAYQMQSALSQAMNLPPSRDIQQLQEMTIINVSSDEISTGVASINPGMAALLKVLAELVDELRRSINFYLNQRGDLEITQLLLAGPGGGIGQIDEFFTQRIGIPAIQIDPIASLSLKVEKDIPSVQRPGLGVVLGLGMREA
ncbi:MAG: type IV pilus assembly protein PilM [Prochloraceae cyanobacterium]|nr:type IV pilus assembly protein PilM [Prochloraceae cyanobacterium]